MDPTPRTPTHRLWAWLALAVSLGALLWVFNLYVQPEFMRGLADVVWGCF